MNSKLHFPKSQNYKISYRNIDSAQKIPIYHGYHICDHKFSKIFKNEFNRVFTAEDLK